MNSRHLALFKVLPLVLMTTLLWPLGCARGIKLVDTAAVEVETALPFSENKLPVEARPTLNATLEIPGLLAQSSLDLKDGKASGVFVVDVTKKKQATAILSVFGAIAGNRPETTLAVFRKKITIQPGQQVRIDAKAGDYNTKQDNGLVLDANNNGSSNLEDLLGRPGVEGSDGRPCDPAAPAPFAVVSTTDLQFQSGIDTGDYARQIVVLENMSNADLNYTAGIVDAPGVSVGRIAVAQASGEQTGQTQIEVLSLEPSTLPVGEIALLSVAFSPASDYLSTGVLQIVAQDRCAVEIASSVRLIANVGTDLQPTDPDYREIDSAAVPELEGYGQPDIISADSLYSGQQFSVAVEEDTEAPEATVDEHPADRVFAVKVPAQHSLAVITSQLYADVDLAVFALDSNGERVERWTSANLGLSVEALYLPFVSETNVLIVVGRKRGQVGAEAVDPDAAFSVSAHLVGAPRFTEPPDPAEDELFGGATVTLRGENFASSVQVLFGDAAATDVQVLDQGRTITCIAPEGVLDFGSNPATITVENIDTGFVATLPQAFLYLPGAPSIVSVTPNVISTAGPTPVTIVGTDFANRFGTPRVFFAGEQALGVNYVNSTRLEVIAPAIANAGPADVTVQNLRPNNTFVEGTQTAAVEYQTPSSPAPTLTGVSPSEADIRGGAVVTLTGTGFIDGALVYFGGSVSSNVVVVSATELQATVPPGTTAGFVDIVVINPDAQSTTQQVPFLYTPPPAADPVLLGISPRAIHAEIPGDDLILLGDALGPDPFPSAVSLVASDGTTHYAASLDTVGTSAIRVLVVDALPAAPGYWVELIYPGGNTITSPTFTAMAPQIFGPEVISGLPQEGTDFAVAIHGDMLNPDHVTAIVLSNGVDADVHLAPSIATENLVHATVPAGALSQGAFSVALLYDNGFRKTASTPLEVEGECNNGVKNPGEECDTSDFGADSCLTLGYVGGDLACTSACTRDTSGCHRCGNNQVDEGEQCDDQDLDNASCLSLGYDDGVLLCTSSCTYDATGCSDCGNGIIEADYEQCDSNQLNGATCSGLGFTDGTLACGSDCSLDTSACYTCGDTLCSLAEDNTICPADCPTTCGDTTCEGTETCLNCPVDCAVCQPFHAVVTGGGQSATILTVLPQPIAVTVLDTNDQPVTGVTVEVTPPPGGWVLYDPLDGITDETGIVRATVGMNSTPGAKTITVNATSPDATQIHDVPVTVDATATDITVGTLYTLVNRSASSGTGLDPSGSAVRTALNGPEDITYDGDGNLYVADTGNHRVIKVDADGAASLFAGNGEFTNSGDGGPAVSAGLRRPKALVADENGNLFIAGELQSHQSYIRRVDENGVIEAFAGGGDCSGTLGDGGFRTEACLTDFEGITYHRASGDVWTSHGAAGGVRIRRIDGDTGMVSTEAQYSTDLLCFEQAGELNSLTASAGMHIDAQGRLIASFKTTDSCGTTQGYIMRLWQRESNGRMRWLVDQNAQSRSIAQDASGAYFFTDPATHTVSSVNSLGEVSLLAGDGNEGFSGDFGPATDASLANPFAVALSPSGDLAILDRDNHAVRILRSPAQTTPPAVSLAIASGNGQSSVLARPLPQPLVVSATSDGQPIENLSIQFSALDPGGVIEPAIAITNAAGEAAAFAWVGRAPGDYRFSAQALGAYGDPVGATVTLTGTATSPSSGDVLVLVNDIGERPTAVFELPAPATKAAFRITDTVYQDTSTPEIAQVAVAPAGAPNAGTLFFTEWQGHRVVGVTPAGEAYVVAGNGEGFNTTSGRYTGNGGPAAQAGLDNPRGVAVDSQGNIYIADTDNHVVRVVTPDGIINNFAGGAADSAEHGDGLVASAANLEWPSSMAIDSSDNLYITEGTGKAGRCRVRRVDGTTGIISTVWKNTGDTCTYCYATTANIGALYDVAVDSTGEVFIGARIHFAGSSTCLISCATDCENDTVFKLDGAGGIESVYVREASDNSSKLVSVAGHPSDGSILFTDGHAIKRRASDGTVTLVTGGLETTGFLPVDTTPSALTDKPEGLNFDSSGNLYFIDSLARVRMIDSP